MSAPELQLRYAYDAGAADTLGLHVVRNTGNGVIAFIGDDQAAAEAWAARHNSPTTYGDISDRLPGPWGKGLVESIQDHQHHATDALGYMLAAWPRSGPPPPQRPWPVRMWRSARVWLANRLVDLAEWIAP